MPRSLVGLHSSRQEEIGIVPPELPRYLFAVEGCFIPGRARRSRARPGDSRDLCGHYTTRACRGFVRDGVNIRHNHLPLNQLCHTTLSLELCQLRL